MTGISSPFRLFWFSFDNKTENTCYKFAKKGCNPGRVATFMNLIRQSDSKPSFVDADVVDFVAERHCIIAYLSSIVSPQSEIEKHVMWLSHRIG